MCEPVICGTLLALTMGSLGVMGGYESWKLRKESRRTALLDGLHMLEISYQSAHASQRPTAGLSRPDICTRLGLTGFSSRTVRKTMGRCQDIRDRIVFREEPPTAKDARGYLAAQAFLKKIDAGLLYVFDPDLFLNPRRRALIMDKDIRGCTDGSYRSSIEFAAHYRELVGEESFQARLEDYLSRDDQPEEGSAMRSQVQQMKRPGERKPWYFGRSDYHARLAHPSQGDAF